MEEGNHAGIVRTDPALPGQTERDENIGRRLRELVTVADNTE